MSTVLEPRNSGLMGRELYKESSRSGIESTSFVADVGDRAKWERCFAKLREIRSYATGSVPDTMSVGENVRTPNRLKSGLFIVNKVVIE